MMIGAITSGSHDYRVILMDCMMPGIDGLQADLACRAAEGERHTTIIAMTGMAMPGDRERCMAAGSCARGGTGAAWRE